MSLSSSQSTVNEAIAAFLLTADAYPEGGEASATDDVSLDGASARLLSVLIFPAISLGLLRDKTTTPPAEDATREPTTDRSGEATA